MAWIPILLVTAVLLYDLVRCSHQLSSLRMKATTAEIVRSRVATFDNDHVEFPVPDVRFEYKVDDITYFGDLTAGPVLHSSGDYEEVADICREYKPGTQIDAWYDPKYPSRVTLKRKFDRNRIFRLLIDCSILAILLIGAPIKLESLLILGILCVFGLIIWFGVEDFYRDNVEGSRALDLKLTPVELSKQRRIDRRFFKKQEKVIETFGFQKLGAYVSEILERTGRRNCSLSFLSEDKVSIATIGQIYYRKFFAGIIPLPFAGTKAVQFETWFSNDTTLTTTQNPKEVVENRPAPLLLQKLDESLSLAEVYEKHKERVQEICRKEDVEVKPFESLKDVFQMLSFQIAQIAKWHPILDNSSKRN